MKKILIIIFLLMSLVFVRAENSVTLPIAFCKHLGYTIGISVTNIPECIFEDGTRCNASEFYLNQCGQDKVKVISPRKEGQTIYFELGETCDEGLIPSKTTYLLEQSKCIKPNMGLFNKILDFIKNAIF